MPLDGCIRFQVSVHKFQSFFEEHKVPNSTGFSAQVSVLLHFYEFFASFLLFGCSLGAICLLPVGELLRCSPGSQMILRLGWCFVVSWRFMFTRYGCQLLPGLQGDCQVGLAPCCLSGATPLLFSMCVLVGFILLCVVVLKV